MSTSTPEHTNHAQTRNGRPGSQGANPWLLAAAPVVALAALVVAMFYSGSGGPRLAADPGALVRWGLPVAEVIHDSALVVVMGSLLFALGVVPRTRGGVRRRTGSGDRGAGEEPEHPLFTATLRLAAAASVVWTVAAVAVLVLSYSDLAGLPVGWDASYAQQLLHYATDFPTGQAQATVVVVAAVVTTLVVGVRALLGLLVTFVLACAALVAMALTGHAVGNDHMGAVNSLGLHLLGVCLWTGGLVVLAWLSPLLSAPNAGTGTLPEGAGRGAGARRRVPIAAVVLRRFSAVALGSFFLVFVSGVLNAAVRIGTWEQLVSPYGQLVLFKAALTLALGLAGLAHRRWLIPGLEAGRLSARRVVWQVVAGEVLVMGAVMGVAVALSRTAPPVPEELAEDATPAEILTWYPLPPEPTAGSWVTTWRVDPLWLVVVVFLAAVYLWAFVKVRRRGDTWSVLRTLSWLTGLGALFYVTSGGVAVYGLVLFSAHMVEHMLLTMVVPIFLVLGAPVTLLLKALEPRQDGTRGPREWILRLVHSTFGRIVTHPVFAAVNFAASIVIFYFTPLFGFTLRYHVGHVFMITHFLLTGYLFMLVLIGIDPIPRRPAHMMRLILLLATMVYHAFVGVALMSADSLLQGSYFANLGRDWGRSPVEDQQLGGALMWGIGEFPTVVVAVVVAIMWAIEGGKENRRVDRAADRTDDAELKAYNEMMTGLAEQDERTTRP